MNRWVMRRDGGLDVPRWSSALRTTSKDLNQGRSNCGSLMLAWTGAIRTEGLNAEAVRAATCLGATRTVGESDGVGGGGGQRTRALLCLMSFFLKRNWRLRLERSIVSRSSRVMWPKPASKIFFTVQERSSV